MVQVRVTFLLHNMAIPGSCTYLVLTGPRIGSLLFHMLVFYWHTCHVAVGSRVTSSLDHVSYFYWSTWPFLIRPCVTLLSVHVSFFDSTMWLDDFLPRVRFLFAMCHAMAISRVMHKFVYMSHFYLIMWTAQVLPRA